MNNGNTWDSSRSFYPLLILVQAGVPSLYCERTKHSLYQRNHPCTHSRFGKVQRVRPCEAMRYSSVNNPRTHRLGRDPSILVIKHHQASQMRPLRVVLLFLFLMIDRLGLMYKLQVYALTEWSRVKNPLNYAWEISISWQFGQLVCLRLGMASSRQVLMYSASLSRFYPWDIFIPPRRQHRLFTCANFLAFIQYTCQNRSGTTAGIESGDQNQRCRRKFVLSEG